MSGPVSCTLADGIATIALDDGKVNALSIATLRALHEAFDEAEREQAVVVLTGREGYFSAGFDLRVFGEGIEPTIEMLRLGATLTERMLLFPRPIVLASSGHAVAAGAFLLLAADVRIGVDGPFRVGLNEVEIGLTMPLFVIELARRRLHPARLDEAILNAAIYEPRAAVEVGYLDRVVDAGQLLASARETAERLLALNSHAYTASKQRLRGAAAERVREAIETELTPDGLAAAAAPS